MPPRIDRGLPRHRTSRPGRPARPWCAAIVDSLAGGLCRAVRAAAALSGRPVEVRARVGGRRPHPTALPLIADASRLPVLAGPVEATALGNVLVQARALGVDLPDLDSMRDLLRRTQSVVRYDPATRSGAG